MFPTIHSRRLFKAIQEENEYTNTQRQFAFQWYEFPLLDNEVIKTFDLNISSLCFDNHYFWTFEWWGGNLEWGNVWKILLIAPQNGKYYNWRKNVLCKTQEFIALAVWFCVFHPSYLWKRSLFGNVIIVIIIPESKYIRKVNPWSGGIACG